MPKYVVFLITANRPEAGKTKDNNEITKDPHFQKWLHEFLDWIKAEVKNEHIKDGDVLLESSEDTNIRIDFHEPGTPGSPNKPQTIPDMLGQSTAEPDKTDSGPALPPPNSSVTRGHQPDMSTNILSYYTAEFPSVNEAIAWARSCPISYDGFALEIRQLKDLKESIDEAPPEVREWTGDYIVSVRKQLLEEGKMKKEEDGTQWVKLEDQEGIKEMVVEAEEREAQKEQD